MGLVPQKNREAVFQILFSLEMAPESSLDELIEVVMQQLKITRKYAKDALERAQHIVTKATEIDALLEKKIKNWSLDRLQKVDKTILHLSLYELLHDKEIPPRVVVAEAKRLAKKFSSDEAGGFVAGILSSFLEESLEGK